MAQLLVRDIPEEVVTALKRRAKRHGRSAEAEHREILREALKSSSDSFWNAADRFRQELEEEGRHFSDSAKIVREERDKR
ncbi:MAG TPA: Arc family DNA-binding protein [Rhizomicrobium sp.]|nr:Arc family DNA-binding protein [Rhizomicrobium sp.]